MVHFDKVINRVVEKLHCLLSSHDLWGACLTMDLSDVHVSINMPRSYTVPISASEHLCGVEAFLHQFLLLFIICSIIFYTVAEEINYFLNFL